MLLRYVYVSAAPAQTSPEIIQEILDVSRNNNARDNITGLLIYHDGNFFQVLEGPDAAVTACYDRIGRDSRHTGLINLLRVEPERRLFPVWSMSFVPFSKLDPEQQAHFFDLKDLWETGTSRLVETDPAVHTLLHVFLDSFSYRLPYIKSA